MSNSNTRAWPELVIRIEAVELVRVRMELVAPFRTAYGSEHGRDVLLVRVDGPDGDGWGECTALAEPRYTAEWADGAAMVTERFLVPALAAACRVGGSAGLAAVDVREALAGIAGHPMAKAALEMAVLDAELRALGESLGRRLGAVAERVPAGVSVGTMGSIDELCAVVDGLVADGYRRVKLKVAPGHTVAPVRAVRERHPTLALQVDANGSFARSVRHTNLANAADAVNATGAAEAVELAAAELAPLDDLDLLLIEQPLAADDLLGHAELARRLRTPLCLDESIVSVASTAVALALGACSVVNIKPGRVGGLLDAVRIHDLCVAQGVPVWCGGMFETGVGRAANVALAALANFTLPGDLSASARYYRRDIIDTPFVLDSDGCLSVPTGPGLGVTVDRALLADLGASSRVLRLR